MERKEELNLKIHRNGKVEDMEMNEEGKLIIDMKKAEHLGDTIIDAINEEISDMTVAEVTYTFAMLIALLHSTLARLRDEKL